MVVYKTAQLYITQNDYFNQIFYQKCIFLIQKITMLKNFLFPG